MICLHSLRTYMETKSRRRLTVGGIRKAWTALLLAFLVTGCSEQPDRSVTVQGPGFKETYINGRSQVSSGVMSVRTPNGGRIYYAQGSWERVYDVAVPHRSEPEN